MSMKTSWRGFAWASGGFFALGVVFFALRISASKSETWWILPILLIASGASMAVIAVRLYRRQRKRWR